uniref:Uncharacterized protein n=1 Tax=Anopheles funestus TaxID=62324 RepID=A0A182RVX4_ANOFN
MTKSAGQSAYISPAIKFHPFSNGRVSVAQIYEPSVDIIHIKIRSVNVPPLMVVISGVDNSPNPSTVSLGDSPYG